MPIIVIDFETRSKGDLKEIGAWAYACHPSTEIISMAWKTDGASGVWVPTLEFPVPGIDITEGQVPELFKNPDNEYVAHNVQFDGAIVINVLIPRYGFPRAMSRVSAWHCTASMAASNGLPRSLANAAAYLKLTNQKSSTGDSLIQTYSIPVKDTMGELQFRGFTREDFEKMIRYNIQDVETTWELFQLLKNNTTVRVERPFYLHDALINWRGIRVDVPVLETVSALIDTALDTASTAMARVGIKKANSVPQLLEFLAARHIVVKDGQAETLAAIKTADALVREILGHRAFVSLASLKKFSALKDVIVDGRLYGFLKYFGAHTGRFSSHGFQIHNLVKSMTKDATVIDADIAGLSPQTPARELGEAAQRILPGLLIPDDGKVFLMGDFNAIEARVLAWLAPCPILLDQFSRDEDPYRFMAAMIYNIGVDMVSKEKHRPLGKRAVLGCGYGCGAPKFEVMCADAGMRIPADLSERAVNTYRGIYKEVPAFWRAIEHAFKTVLKTRHPYVLGHLTISALGGAVLVRLPSGRSLVYHDVQVNKYPAGMTFMSPKTQTAVKIWGGTLTENVCQAVAADILKDRMLTCEADGLPISFHVHDEAVAMGIESDLEKFNAIMNEAPEWAPGFPLKTESFTSTRYYK